MTVTARPSAPGGLWPDAVPDLPRFLRCDPVSRHTRIVLWALAGLILLVAVVDFVLEPWYAQWLSADPALQAELSSDGEPFLEEGARSGVGLVLRAVRVLVPVVGTLIIAWQPSLGALVALLGTAVSLLGFVGPDQQEFTPMIFSGGVVLAALMAARYSRTAFLWTAAGALVALTVTGELLVDPDTPEHTGEQGLMVVTLVASFLVAVPALFVRRVRHRARDRLAALEAAERRAVEAAEAERARIATELHDVVAHGLTVISMQASMLPTLTDPERRRDAEEAIEGAARQSLVDLRRMLTALRGTSRNEGTGEGDDDVADLRARLTEFRTRLEGAGYTMEGTLEGLGELPPSLRLTVLRVAQEATTNVLKHGPGAGAVTLATRLDAQGRLKLRIDSPLAGAGASGTGSHAALREAWRPLPASGFGLAGMAERVNLFGGGVAMGPVDGRWVVDAVLPTR